MLDTANGIAIMEGPSAGELPPCVLPSVPPLTTLAAKAVRGHRQSSSSGSSGTPSNWAGSPLVGNCDVTGLHVITVGPRGTMAASPSPDVPARIDRDGLQWDLLHVVLGVHGRRRRRSCPDSLVDARRAGLSILSFLSAL